MNKRHLIWIVPLLLIIGYILGYISGLTIPKDITISIDKETRETMTQIAQIQHNTTCINPSMTGWCPSNNFNISKLYYYNNISFKHCCYPKECKGLYNNTNCDNTCVYPVACFTLKENETLQQHFNLK